MIIGILFIYSSGVTSDGWVFSNEYIKQIIWAFLGLGILTALLFFDYNRYRDLSSSLYIGFILLLVITLLIGKRVNGARSWLGVFDFGIQPSEFTKIATMLFLAHFLESRKNSIQKLSTFSISLGIVMLPVLLILIQPDMGTALVYLPIFFVMTLVAGARLRYILFLFIAGMLTIFMSIFPAYTEMLLHRDLVFNDIISNPQYIMIDIVALSIIGIIAFIGYRWLKKGYYYWIIYSLLILISSLLGSVLVRMVLKDYQMTRLIVFLDPGVDPQGAGWNVIQSITAVGSGGFSGKGFLQGTQSHYRFLPQQSTDFIFSIIAEEWGFLGSIIILLLYGIILIRGMFILLHSKDTFGVYVGSGIVAMIFFHVIINIGMAIGIMPVTGIPLMFLSYGGSSLWTGLIGVGLLLNIHLRRYSY
ncbi:MAG: rod shape-determining protein RodA [Spirochaetales bacterium]|nr:rod shape-determining protein RodA [Spirochaetales bacterium]